MGHEIIIDGKNIPNPLGNGHNISIINDRVFANEYEYRGGDWVKTFWAMWHKYF